jgi:hypothetical protein
MNFNFKINYKTTFKFKIILFSTYVLFIDKIFDIIYRIY